MKHAKELVDAIKNITGIPDSVFPAVVTSVDKTLNVCDVSYGDMEFGNVRLQAIIKADTKGLKIYPVVNSVVLVERIGSNGEMSIAMYSEIESVSVQVDVTTMVVNDGFLFQKNAETLKKILDDLLDGINQIIVPTNVGPSGTPLNATTFTAIKRRVDQLLK